MFEGNLNHSGTTLFWVTQRNGDGSSVSGAGFEKPVILWRNGLIVSQHDSIAEAKANTQDNDIIWVLGDLENQTYLNNLDNISYWFAPGVNVSFNNGIIRYSTGATAGNCFVDARSANFTVTGSQEAFEIRAGHIELYFNEINQTANNWFITGSTTGGFESSLRLIGKKITQTGGTGFYTNLQVINMFLEVEEISSSTAGNPSINGAYLNLKNCKASFTQFMEIESVGAIGTKHLVLDNCDVTCPHIFTGGNSAPAFVSNLDLRFINTTLRCTNNAIQTNYLTQDNYLRFFGDCKILSNSTYSIEMQNNNNDLGANIYLYVYIDGLLNINKPILPIANRLEYPVTDALVNENTNFV